MEMLRKNISEFYPCVIKCKIYELCISCKQILEVTASELNFPEYETIKHCRKTNSLVEKY